MLIQYITSQTSKMGNTSIRKSSSCANDDEEFTNINNPCYSSTIGLDYFDFVNERIKTILYPKPNTSESQLKELNNINGTKIFTITNNKLNIKTCVCEIKPKQSKELKKSKQSIETDKFKIIIFSHGNACDIYTSYSYLKLLADNLNVIVISYDYPTYGLSEGEINESTCTQALDDVVSHYLKQTDKILLIGQSLGTGILVNYASKYSWKNPIILISPYKSIPKVVTDYNFIEHLVSKHKYASYQKISCCVCKIKIFHGKSDDVINVSNGLELYNLAPNTFKPTWFNNTGHNDILNKIDLTEYNKILQLI